jgi:hypothetical protein
MLSETSCPLALTYWRTTCRLVTRQDMALGFSELVSPINDPFHFQISLIVCIHLQNSTVFDLHVDMATLRVQEGFNFTGIFADIDDASTGDSAVDRMCKQTSLSSVFLFGEELICMKNQFKLT